uniref:Reverse transcriptase domain-containing protein n=1 Tax=Hucho hucho TaxID=62062 RepID=A0A4W5MJ42_9TELE
MEERSQRNADECLARAVYATASPLMLTGNVYWKRFLNVLCPAYTPPTSHALSTHLLDAEFNRVQVKVKQIIEKADCIVIISDRWSNVRGQGIINYIISTPQPVFYKSTDPALCNWVLDFLTGRPQVVRIGNNISTLLILNTGAPQGCVLSPLLYSLFTHDCVAKHASNSIIKFAYDTKVVGLITNNDETAYREEVRALGVWCQENNLSLNVNKTKEMIVDFRKQERAHPPIHIDGTVVEKVESFKFLGVHITDKLKWSTHIDSVVKKVQQRLFNLRRLKKFSLSPKTLTNVYRCTIESILSGCITTWYGNCSAHNRKALQRVVRTAQGITGGKLPALQDTYTTRCHRKAKKIIKDNNHPSHCLFTLLSSRRRCQNRCIKSGTERLKNSSYLKAIRLLNSHH